MGRARPHAARALATQTAVMTTAEDTPVTHDELAARIAAVSEEVSALTREVEQIREEVRSLGAIVGTPPAG